MGCPPERDTWQTLSYYVLVRKHIELLITQKFRRTSLWGYTHVHVILSKHKWLLYFWEFWIQTLILQICMLVFLYESHLTMPTNPELHLPFQYEMGRHVCVLSWDCQRFSFIWKCFTFQKGRECVAYHQPVWVLSKEKQNTLKQKHQKALKQKQFLLILHPGYVLTLQNHYN